MFCPPCVYLLFPGMWNVKRGECYYKNNICARHMLRCSFVIVDTYMSIHKTKKYVPTYSCTKSKYSLYEKFATCRAEQTGVATSYMRTYQRILYILSAQQTWNMHSKIHLHIVIHLQTALSHILLFVISKTMWLTYAP